MAARAWLVDRRLEVDAKGSRASIVPLRWPGLLFVPAFASTPIALFWAQFYSGGGRLTTAGWVIMIVYALVALYMAVMFVSPANKHVVIDFAAARLSVGDVTASFDKLWLVEEAITGGRRRARLAVRIDERRFVLLDTANEAAVLPGVMIRAIKDGNVEALEHETTRVGDGQGKKFIMTLVLMLAPGLMFAYAAIF